MGTRRWHMSIPTSKRYPALPDRRRLVAFLVPAAPVAAPPSMSPILDLRSLDRGRHAIHSDQDQNVTRLPDDTM
jgi:hypothetical protein